MLLKDVTLSAVIAILLLTLLNLPHTQILRKAKKKERKKDDLSTKTKLDKRISISASVVSLVCVLLSLIVMFFTNLSGFGLVLEHTGIVIYLLLASFTCKILLDFMSPKRTDTTLTPVEQETLVLAALLIFLGGMYRLKTYDYDTSNVGLLICAVIILEYSAYLFALASQLVLLIHNHADCVGKALLCGNNVVKVLYNKADDFVFNKKWDNSASINALNIVKKSCGWRSIFNAVRLAGCVVLDFLISMLFYLAKVPLGAIYVVLDAVKLLCESIQLMVEYVKNISVPRAVTISFRFSILVATLMVVVLNEYEIIHTNCHTTNVLQFIASVVTIPLLFSWIQEAFERDKKKHDCNKCNRYDSDSSHDDLT